MSVMMGVAYANFGLPMGVCVLICLLTGTICGFVKNGFILSKFPELAPMIVTLGTQILYQRVPL